MLQKDASNYKFLAVGKIMNFTGPLPIPDEHLPVNVLSIIDQSVSQVLIPGQAVFWPRALLALPKVQQPEKSDKNTEVPSLTNPALDKPSTQQEDQLYNYGLQIIQLGLMLQ